MKVMGRKIRNRESSPTRGTEIQRIAEPKKVAITVSRKKIQVMQKRRSREKADFKRAYICFMDTASFLKIKARTEIK
jgi:hypothetical protein